MLTCLVGRCEKTYLINLASVGEWVKCVIRTRTRVRVAREENTCSSKIYALKA